MVVSETLVQTSSMLSSSSMAKWPMLLRVPFLSNAHFKFLEAVAANGATKTHNGRFADLRFLGKVHDAHMNNMLSVFQNILRHFDFRLAQRGQRVVDIGQNRAMVHRAFP